MSIATDEKAARSTRAWSTARTFRRCSARLDDEYMQARAADIGDISQRVIKSLEGHRGKRDRHDHRAVHHRVANDLTPSDTREDGRQAGCRLYHEDRRPHEPFGHHGAL
ncbi:MAG: hypothetical protein ACLR4Z_08605 [Butyricicoccaceae bacterium]